MSVLRVNQAFSVLSDPSGRVYVPGDLVLDSDPIAKSHASYFEPVETVASRNAPVEQATAAPGERRSVTKKSATKKSAQKSEPKKTTEGDPS